MTREEAKEFLIDVSYKLGNMAVEYLTEKDGEKMREAIKALEQEPCEDCISRQALYESLYESFHDEDAPNNITQVTLGAVRNFVKNFPPVTPQSKTGHWIFVDKVNEHAHCSECDYGNVDLLDGRPHNYCPNCGAKMESEDV